MRSVSNMSVCFGLITPDTIYIISCNSFFLASKFVRVFASLPHCLCMCLQKRERERQREERRFVLWSFMFYYYNIAIMIIFASFCCFYGRPSSKRSKYLCVFREPLTAVHRRRRDIASSPSIRLSAVIVTHTLSITHLYLQRRLHTYFYYYFMAFSYFVDIFFTYVAADEGDREKGEEEKRRIHYFVLPLATVCCAGSNACVGWCVLALLLFLLLRVVTRYPSI